MRTSSTSESKSIEMPSFSSSVQLSNDYLQGIADAPKRQSKCAKVTKAVALAALPAAVAATSLVTRFVVCNDMSSDQCMDEHVYLHPIEVVGGFYAATVSVAYAFKYISNSMFS